jgi:GWxTD domain-containing protein
MKKALLLLVVFLAGCATFRFERKLPPDLREWYSQHFMLMETKAPAQLDSKQPTEKVFFLRLPDALKKEYIAMFWKIREDTAEAEFKNRVAIAAEAFKAEGVEGWRTDRGKLMLLCGQPDYVDRVDASGQLEMAGNEEWLSDAQGHYQQWTYWLGSGLHSQTIRFYFKFQQPNTWRLAAIYDSDQRRLFEYWRFRMGPTEDGWKAVYEKFAGK